MFRVGVKPRIHGGIIREISFDIIWISIGPSLTGLVKTRDVSTVTSPTWVSNNLLEHVGYHISG